jgi:uncharacterized damage-inducible protein DinB
MTDYFHMLARYNTMANQRIYEACAQLEEIEYRKQRAGSFGSIHALLNHVLLSDQIWRSRFEGGGYATPPLDTVLHNDFAALRSARAEEDARLERFFAQLGPAFFARSFRYRNSKGKDCVESAPVALAHFFNHQTHHRGQIHVMLSQTPAPPPSLDLHRIINP